MSAVVGAAERPPADHHLVSTQPKEKTSLRASAGWPRTCSGDMYATVPSSVPGCVSSVRSAGCGGSRLGLQAGQAEIEDLHAAVGGQEDVLRLDVAVDDALGVGGGQPVGDRRGDFHRLPPVDDRPA